MVVMYSSPYSGMPHPFCFRRGSLKLSFVSSTLFSHRKGHLTQVGLKREPYPLNDKPGVEGSMHSAPR